MAKYVKRIGTPKLQFNFASNKIIHPMSEWASNCENIYKIGCNKVPHKAANLMIAEVGSIQSLALVKRWDEPLTNEYTNRVELGVMALMESTHTHRCHSSSISLCWEVYLILLCAVCVCAMCHLNYKPLILVHLTSPSIRPWIGQGVHNIAW